MHLLVVFSYYAHTHVYECECVFTNPEQTDLGILVKYLSFLVFPKDLTQKTIKRKLSIRLKHIIHHQRKSSPQIFQWPGRPKK